MFKDQIETQNEGLMMQNHKLINFKDKYNFWIEKIDNFKKKLIVQTLKDKRF